MRAHGEGLKLIHELCGSLWDILWDILWGNFDISISTMLVLMYFFSFVFFMSFFFNICLGLRFRFLQVAWFWCGYARNFVVCKVFFEELGELWRIRVCGAERHLLGLLGSFERDLITWV